MRKLNINIPISIRISLGDVMLRSKWYCFNLLKILNVIVIVLT